MYESFYGLRRRPFAAAPDAEVTVETPAVADAVERLDRCVRHGRGVGVLTAAAGMGKTHLCHRLARLWDGRFRTAILPNAGFPTRRGLLQAILAELDEPYQRLGETELRLELTAVAKAARSDSGGIVLLLDEAHRYSERLLDEVRLVANLVEGGEPLVRVVLAGQVELEDKLSDPSLAGLNERVGELVTLPRLTAEESRHYLRERASHAGSRLEDLFDPEAAELIVQACGGTPRCLNQLADHALLLGYVAERRPVGVGLVREALDDLKRLPLQWHDPLPSAVAPGDQAREPEVAESATFSSDAEGVIEIGGLSEEPESAEHIPDAVPSTGSVERPAVRRATDAPTHAVCESSARVERPATEPIRDRFARIDAAEARRRWFEELERIEKGSSEPAPGGSPAPAVTSAVSGAAPAEPRPAANPLETLDRLEPLVAAAMEGTEQGATVPATTHRIDSRAELDRLVSALEQAAGRPQAAPDGTQLPRRVTRHSTLFSDLRRGRPSPGAK